MTEAVLVFVFRHRQVLLGQHQRGIGKGRWNGLGGKVEGRETLKQAAVRECRQEAGILVKIGSSLGELLYHHERYGDWRVTVFRTEEFSGQPHASAEMVPEWFATTRIPYAEMWTNDAVWLPYVLKRRHFRGEVWLKRDDSLDHHTIVEIESLHT